VMTWGFILQVIFHVSGLSPVPCQTRSSALT
jgi:hypothetical protein